MALASCGALAALALLSCAGCSAEAPTTADRVVPEVAPELAPALANGARVPSDLTVDVTVLVGRGAPEVLLVEGHQAKYLLLPDGGLHADAGPFIDISTRPGRSRWLYEEQVGFVWSAFQQTGFANPADANGPPNPDLLQVSAGERLVIITLRAHGKAWSYVRRSIGSEPIDPAAARVIRTLAALAWMPDLVPADLLPERYDYGPDPYAVYREIRERERTYFLR